MSKLFVFSLPMVVASLVIISGCSGITEEEAFETIEETVENAFYTESPDPNEELELFQLYISDQFEVVEDSPSNLIFRDDAQMFILFYNTFEAEDSDLFYLSAKANDDFSLLETFEDEERFGYLKVADKEDSYELQVGIGGVKITTQTTLGDLEENAADMMEMINSIVFLH